MPDDDVHRAGSRRPSRAAAETPVAVPQPATTSTRAPAVRVPVAGGKLPDWAPWGAVVGAAVVVGVILLVIGFNLALFLVAHGDRRRRSRSTSGRAPSRARAAPPTVPSPTSSPPSFLTALAPLVSLLFTVIKRGSTRFDVDFFTESMRGVIGEGGGALHAHRRHADHHRLRDGHLGADRHPGGDLPAGVRQGQAAQLADVLRRRHDRHPVDRRRPVRLRAVRDLLRARASASASWARSRSRC